MYILYIPKFLIFLILHSCPKFLFLVKKYYYLSTMSEEFTSFDADKVTECLIKQLSELELFQTMYSPKEIILTDPSVVDCIQKFIAKETDYLPDPLDYTIKYTTENIKVEVSVNLPNMYPEKAPDIYVRCNQINGQQEKNLNTELIKYIQSKQDDEVCIFTAISWLQDNIEQFTVETETIPEQETNTAKSLQNFCRYWIYSHHIYSKKKIEEITSLAKDLHLTGFCLVGKPGVMCIEGDEGDCIDWWKHIKSLNWQKIALKITEVYSADEKVDQQKFDSFDVMRFSSPSTQSEGNVGNFHKFMDKYGLLDQANKILGLSSPS